jgi:hypothetical protein
MFLFLCLERAQAVESSGSESPGTLASELFTGNFMSSGYKELLESLMALELLAGYFMSS